MIALTELMASFAIGSSLHIFILRHGEWDLALNKLTASAVVAPIAIALGLRFLSSSYRPGSYHEMWSLYKDSLTLVATTTLGIYTSMLVYRAFFHRLNRFPGPFLGRLSNFYIAARALWTHQEYSVLQSLHKKYGDVVRIGPSSLSINDPRALYTIHAAGSKCIKGPWYTTLHPIYSLQTERDPDLHAQRRRVWDRGFSTKALRSYEPRVSFWGDKLLSHVESKVKQGEPLNVSLWFNFYSFDVMGDLSLGESFGMLDRGKSHWVMESLHTFMFSLGVFGHIMWAYHIFKKLPVVSSENAKFNGWVAEAVGKRMKTSPDVPDVFSWILDEYASKPKPTTQDTINLVGDGVLITIAGSDTTASSLTCLFLELATHPEAVRQLQVELDELFRSTPEPDHYALSMLPYLQACVDEALRLYPAVPVGGQRIAPPEGLEIGEGLFVPGGTIVQTPQYLLHRDERNFARADEFIPERWTTKPQLNKNPSVLSPFLIGPYSCVGKQLALMEIRSVVSRMLWRYDVALAANQTKEAFIEGLVDGFTLACPKLDLVFTPRE